MKWSLSLACCSLLLAATLCQAQEAARRDSARVYVDAGLALAARGDTADAIAEFRKAVRAAPDLAEACFYLGRLLHLSAGADPETRREAELALLRALALEPDNPVYLEEYERVRGDRAMTPEGQRVLEKLGGLERHVLDPDSLVLLDSAKLWQSEFERFRRWNYRRLSERYRCDRDVGRYCLSYLGESGRNPWETVPVDSARDHLIAKLTAAADSEHVTLGIRVGQGSVTRWDLPGIPGDEWIMGQRLRYLVEDGRHDEALALAERCPAGDRWWCSALTGYVFQVTGEYKLAESAFEFARKTMPVAGARWWTDISLFLDGDLRETYVESYGQQRDSLERRFWWLADPLYLTPFNERRTEQFARNVTCRLQTDAASGYGVIWGDDLREIVLRHGWPIGWVVNRQEPYRADYAGVHPAEGRPFLPPMAFVADPTSVRAGDWFLEDRALPETFTPAYARFSSLEHQVAVFQRGDSVVLVAAYDQGVDSAWWSHPVEVGLFLMPDELSVPRVLSGGPDPRGVFSLALEAQPTLMSLELLSAEGRRAARARYGIGLRRIPRMLLAVSDVLVMREYDPLANSLERAGRLARGSLRMRAGEALGLYWEVYGLGPDPETIALSVTLNKVAEGQLGELNEIADRDVNPPLSLMWQETVPAYMPIWGRSLDLSLPSDMSSGLYVLHLMVGAHGREPVHATRAFLVEN